MTTSADIGRLIEIAAGAASLYDYERAALEVVAARVGFEVAMFKRPAGLGAYTPGLDPGVERACRPHWSRFAEEMRPVSAVARASRYVAVDVEVMGLRRMERLEYYQRLMRPHRGTSTAMVYLARRGTVVGALAVGRTRGGFRDDEIEHLRALAPALAVCEAAVLAAPELPYAERGRAALLTSREREVLAHLRLGHTNAQIARALGSAERTVRNQLTSIYAKLGVASRAEAAALSIELGLATVTPT